MWKPGQLVTINNKVYRVTKTKHPDGIVICEDVCDLYNIRSKGRYNPPLGILCRTLCHTIQPKLGQGLYLKRIQCRDKSAHK